MSLSLPSLTKNEKLILASVVLVLLLFWAVVGGYVWIKSKEYTAPITVSPAKSQPITTPTATKVAKETPDQQIIPTEPLGQIPSLALEIDNFKLPLSSPFITDIAIRLEGTISTITPETVEITYNGQKTTIPLQKETQFYLRDKDKHYKQIKINQLQLDQAIQVSLHRTSDNKFAVNSITILE